MAVSSPTNQSVSTNTPGSSYTDFSNVITANQKGSEQNALLQASIRETNTKDSAEQMQTTTVTNGNKAVLAAIDGSTGSMAKVAKELAQSMKS